MPPIQQDPVVIRLLTRLAGAVDKGTSPAYHARMLARLGMAAGTAASGMAASGFRGTVEGNRMNLELQMISRELAGAFLPAIKAVTGALQIFRKWLEKIGPQTQSLIMLGGLAAGGLGAVGLARAGVGGIGRLLGMGGVAAAGTMAAGGAGTVAAARAAGARAAVPFGAIGAGAAMFGYGHEAVGIGAGIGAARGAAGTITWGGTTAAAARSGALRGAARVAAPLALGATAVEAASGGYYSELRARGTNKLGSAIGALGGGAMDFVSFGAYGDAFRKRRGTGGEFSTAEARAKFETGGGEDRGKVTYADAGFDAPGTAFERITNALAIVGANEERTDLEGIVGDIRDMFRQALGLEKKPSTPAMPTT